MNEHLNISVVIPAKNEEQFLMLCLDSIKKAFSCNDNYEIIVVDNNSKDKTCEIAKNYDCKVIQNQKSGAGATRNAGASLAKGEFIAFVDADCVINKKWFQFTKEHFQDVRVVAVGTKISPNFDNATWVENAVFSLNNRRGVVVSEKAIKVRWLGTSNMLVRKTAFDKVKGFKEYLITCEDYDFCERLSEIGDILLDKRINTVHLREETTLKELFCRELWRGQDSLRHWMNSEHKLHEAPSIFIPGFFLFFIFLGLVAILLNFKFGVTLWCFALICPVLMVLRSKKVLSNPLLFMQCLLVSSTYLLSRGVALIKDVIVGIK